MEIERWNIYWCFFNSLAFSNITVVALLGAVIIVVPALATLPPEIFPRLGDFHTEYIILKKYKGWTWFLGIAAIAASILIVIFYLRILTLTHAKTCDMNFKPENYMFAYINILYLLSISGLGLIGMFYIYLQRTYKKHEFLVGHKS